ncbi:MAG: branched-chain amino acid ABC transporter permease [Acidimicrobiia bacterium]
MTEFLQLAIQGLALGSIYALIALGFVIIYKATEVINFSHGALMLLGAYVTFTFTTAQIPNPFGDAVDFPSWLGWWSDLDIKWRFTISVALAVMAVAGVGILIERTILRKMVGQPVFAVILITLGLELVIRTGVQITWNPQQKSFPSPFQAGSSVSVGGVAISTANLFAIGVTLLLVPAFFVFFRYSRFGVAMRATAFDQEAAMSLGIKASTVFAIAWAIAGGLAAVAGAFFVPARLAGFLTITPVAFSALRAFPAAILGGLDSPGGAVLGGIIIGEAEVLTSFYISDDLFDLGFANFHLVLPYVIMIAILLVRPYGLFGTREVRRV